MTQQGGKTRQAQQFIQSICACTFLWMAACSGDDNMPVSDEASGADAGVTLSEYPDKLLWGDTHLHTSNSIDAFGFGTRLDAEAALRFARGEKVTATKGTDAQLNRPLDFLVISDHSDGLGATKQLYETPRLVVRALGNALLLRWWDMMHESEEGGLRVTAELIEGAATNTLPDNLLNGQDDRINELWEEHGKTVDRFNEPGKFSAFMGYEYTSMPGGDNLHRVVMYRDGADKATQMIPFPSVNNLDPEKLWAWMAQYEQKTGGRVLAIPHNSNISNGRMFAMRRYDGSALDKAYVQTRARYEPVVEITQIKGDSESHPLLSPNDEFANYGDDGWDFCNLSCTGKTSDAMQAGNYVREAYKRGLQIKERTGINPYKFGVIGSTDSHTSLATADENNFYGKHSGNEYNAEKRAVVPQNLGTREGRYGWNYLASGYAGVWAKANTRAEIFDAFERREVYATTGPRIRVRFFGGGDFTPNDTNQNMVKAGYDRGVPMGSDLTPAILGTNNPPQFLISAMMDPQSGNLDRVQLVKGWLDEDGEAHERVYDVLWHGGEGRFDAATGKLSPVGNTVDLATGEYTNSIGSAELSGLWTDPDFHPDRAAFYYLRVLEIPTPTWALLDSVRMGHSLGDEVKRVQQERAYSSPIWYTP